jgi:hypothetical protein
MAGAAGSVNLPRRALMPISQAVAADSLRGADAPEPDDGIEKILHERFRRPVLLVFMVAAFFLAGLSTGGISPP